MTIDLASFLPIVLYILLIVLVIILIILGIRLIKTLDKVNGVVEEINGKIHQVDGVFNIIDKTADFAASISDKIIGGITSIVNFVIRKKKGNDENEK